MDHPFIIQNIIVQTDRRLIDKYIKPKKVKTPKVPKTPKEPKKVSSIYLTLQSPSFATSSN